MPAGPNWQEQDAQLRDLWMKKKAPQEISAILGRSTAAIMTRAARLGLPRRLAPGRKPGSKGSPNARKRVDGAQAAGLPTRICLMCLRSFPSQGRHNRICSSCKTSTEYSAAVSLSEINLPV